MTPPPDLLTLAPHALRPAGGGVYVVSTGVAQQQALQRAIYRVPASTPEAEREAIDAAWRGALTRASSAPITLLGVPSDTGAGFTRGANLAPAALRARMIEAHPAHPLLSDNCIDIGDIRVVPQLLSDEMLSEQQRAQTRAALYGDPKMDLPVSPLDLCELTLRALEGEGVPIVLGGDHSVAWPAFRAAHHRWETQRGRRVGLLHVDAHTDLLSERLGVRYCFATWAWHANQLLGADGRLAQVGVRVSGRTQAHWESTCGVRQVWAREVRERGAESIAEELIERFKGRGVECLYVSNDIDGTDAALAAATGTPEPSGLTPDEVDHITRRLCEEFPLIGADLVEVAPPLSREAGEPERTLDIALRYLHTLSAQALLAAPRRAALAR
jgi:arginase family enzyme